MIWLTQLNISRKSSYLSRHFHKEYFCSTGMSFQSRNHWTIVLNGPQNLESAIPTWLLSLACKRTTFTLFFLGHKHVLISKKQLRDTKFDMIEFSSNHKGAGYFPTLNMLAFNFPAPNHLTLSLIRGHQHWNSALFALDHFLHQRGSVNVIILNAVAATSTRKAWRLTLELWTERMKQELHSGIPT